jgi:hypothetical protein
LDDIFVKSAISTKDAEKDESFLTEFLPARTTQTFVGVEAFNANILLFVDWLRITLNKIRVAKGLPLTPYPWFRISSTRPYCPCVSRIEFCRYGALLPDVVVISEFKKQNIIDTTNPPGHLIFMEGDNSVFLKEVLKITYGRHFLYSHVLGWCYN